MSSISIHPSFAGSQESRRSGGTRAASVRSEQVRSGQVRSGQVRLTRRGRVVLFSLALLVVLGAAVLMGAGSVATSHEVTARTTSTVVVGEGDTLWAIASSVAGRGNVSDMVAKIQRMNGMSNGMLQVGQRLRVPKA